MIITAIVLWVVALAFMFVTLKNIIVRAFKNRRCTEPTNGVISEVKQKTSRREGIVTIEYIPTVSYTVDGADYSAKFTKAYHAATYTIGQAVEVMYNPDKPSEINAKGASNKSDIVLFALGILIAIIGAVLLRFQ